MKLEEVKRRYDRIANFYNFYELPMEIIFFKKWRKELLSDLHGRVLEIGVGTGKNLTYYPNDSEVTGIDISPKMLEKARKLIIAKNLTNIDLKIMDAEHIDFPDDYFDFVVGTFVLCSVPDPVSTLKEMSRVCKDNGKIMLLEHMQSQNPFIAKILDFINPLTRDIFGFNVNRKTIVNIKKAGLKIEKAQNLLADIFKMIVAAPK
ncbi:MAG: class I SAM-dependent methyltransferase [Candidatus Hydrothermarchaeota archaeon]